MTAHETLARRSTSRWSAISRPSRWGKPKYTAAQVQVALAYVDTALAVPGTAVQVDVRGAAEAARVVELPFYRRPR